MTVIYSVEYSPADDDTSKDTGKEGTPDKYVIRLLETVGNQTLTVKRMMELMELKGDDNFRKKYLNPAINDGYIALLYPDKPRNKGQSYYLTEKGMKALL